MCIKFSGETMVGKVSHCFTKFPTVKKKKFTSLAKISFWHVSSTLNEMWRSNICMPSFLWCQLKSGFVFKKNSNSISIRLFFTQFQKLRVCMNKNIQGKGPFNRFLASFNHPPNYCSQTIDNFDNQIFSWKSVYLDKKKMIF